MDKRPALGKGLSALIPDAPEPRLSPLEVDVDRLSPNDLQPRGQMDHTALEQLAQSIASSGIIQPIVVRKVGDRFQIIAGERRSPACCASPSSSARCGTATTAGSSRWRSSRTSSARI